MKVDVENSGGTVEIHVSSGQPGSSTDEQNSKKPMKSGSSSVHKELESKEQDDGCKAGVPNEKGENDGWEKISMDVEHEGSGGYPCEKESPGNETEEKSGESGTPLTVSMSISPSTPSPVPASEQQRDITTYYFTKKTGTKLHGRECGIIKHHKMTDPEHRILILINKLMLMDLQKEQYV